MIFWQLLKTQTDLHSPISSLPRWRNANNQKNPHEEYTQIPRLLRNKADTPFAIGSGEKGFTVDRLIARDALGLPYIPGSSLAGVLRHELDPKDDSEEVMKLFGFQAKETGQGSRINFSSAHLIGADGKMVIEGLQAIDLNSGYYSYFQKLPERDHVRMNDRGAADTKGHGKFDEELVHKGTRFAFSIEMSGDESDQQAWQHVLDLIHQPLFRLGAGTRKGFGKLKVISCKAQVFDLQTKNDLLTYLAHGNSLNENLVGWQNQAQSNLRIGFIINST
ncbi:MAG: hypothetical protein IPN74_16835 [Haliscomenobacter sp.]|nr:hypothetical protein [Haliscomenobacter sp.]